MSELEKVKNWIKDFIVDKKICPFALGPHNEDTIFYTQCNESDEDKAVDFFLDHLDFFRKSKPEDVSTSIIIYPNQNKDFEKFYHLTQLMEELVERVGLKMELQIVCFHPDFRFEGVEYHERANLVNRSPYPMIHLLRSKDVQNAVNSMDQGEKIIFINDDFLNSLSETDLKALLGPYLNDKQLGL